MDKQEATEILRELQLYELPCGSYSKAVEIAINSLNAWETILEEIAELKTTKDGNTVKADITRLIKEHLTEYSDFLD